MRAWPLLVTLVLFTPRASPAFSEHPPPSVAWIVTQAIPSPTHAWDGAGSTFALRWQVTPFLWSWGIHRRAPRRWRMFVVEPPMRHSGSLEIFASPAWLADRRFVGWFGARSTFPLVDRGETLALSIATGGWTDLRDVAPAMEVGVHALFGLLGVVLTRSSDLPRAAWAVSLQVRVL